jgi:predicted nucleic acid-binding protein
VIFDLCVIYKHSATLRLILDFVDAPIVVTAERLNIKRLLTLDRRDFNLIRPKRCVSFELLP